MVQMTLTTSDEELCRKIEPNVSTTKERFETLKQMRAAGIPTVVWLSPILPFINDTEENIQEILEILASSGYRRDYRNLLPWGIDGVDSDKNYDGHRFSLLLVWGEESDNCTHIQFLSHSIIAVSAPEKPGFQIYHPTNEDTLYELVEYLQANGTKK